MKKRLRKAHFLNNTNQANKEGIDWAIETSQLCRCFMNRKLSGFYCKTEPSKKP